MMREDDGSAKANLRKALTVQMV